MSTNQIVENAVSVCLQYRPSATHRPCSPPRGIAGSVGLKEGIVRNNMSQELQLSIGAFSCSKSLNMRGNIAIDEKSDCARTTLPKEHRHFEMHIIISDTQANSELMSYYTTEVTPFTRVHRKK